MRVLRNRIPASPKSELRPSLVQRALPVPAGTPASEFVALRVPRSQSFQSSQLRSLRHVALRAVEYACASAFPHSPHSVLKGALTKLRRTVRRNLFARISERFAGPFSEPGTVGKCSVVCSQEYCSK